MGILGHIVMEGLSFLAALFVFAVGIFLLFVIFLFIMDISQTKDAIRHNYPVIGRFRYLFTRLGEFFRQYFFALDREELPFNRAERDWVYRSSIGADNTVAFGSTRNLTPVGTVIFVNCPFPTLARNYGWPLHANSLPLFVDHQHFRHELRRPFRTGCAGAFEGRRDGRLLAQYRRGRLGSLSFGRRMRRYFSDRYSEIWRAGARRSGSA